MDKSVKESYYRIRSLIGILGLCLPFLLVIINGEALPSISIYYYSKVSFIFTAVLFSFGLFLISYKGYEKETDEIINDNWLTNIAGFFILLVIILPTECNLDGLCKECITNHYIFGYSGGIISIFHLCFAGAFFILMGGMSYFKFSRGLKKRKNLFYKICGIIIWLSIVIIGITFFFKIELFNGYQVIIFETIALLFFGISWLVKGKFLNY